MTEERESRNQLPLYITGEHPCSYFSDRDSRTLFLPDEVPKDPTLYQALIDLGFRRSGNMIYRPECNACHDCIPARIPVEQFRPKRSQRRIWNALHKEIETRETEACFDPEHYALYMKYMQTRHPDGEMAETSEEQYLQFLTSEWSQTRFIEFRKQGELLGVAVVDPLPRGLSAVYTFFDPNYSKQSPGVFAILWQIEQARSLGLPWVYLGYWIPDCRKMEYKSEYRPIQFFHRGNWLEFAPGDPLPTSTMEK